jgi:hypothetical protein
VTLILDQQVASTEIYRCVALIGGAGLIGGTLNAFLNDNGFALPRQVKGVWCPGALLNLFVGAVSALISWGLYGAGAGLQLVGNSEREHVSVTVGAAAGALIVGMAGSKWLTSEVDKHLMKQSVVEVAKRNLPPEKCQEIEQCDSPQKILKAVAGA